MKGENFKKMDWNGEDENFKMKMKKVTHVTSSTNTVKINDDELIIGRVSCLLVCLFVWLFFFLFFYSSPFIHANVKRYQSLPPDSQLTESSAS